MTFSNVPLPPPRIVCHDFFSEVGSSAGVQLAFFEILGCDHVYSVTAVAAVWSVAASTIILRELTHTAGFKSGCDGEATLDIVLAMVCDEQVVIPEIRRVLLFCRDQWLADSGTWGEFSLGHMSTMLFGATCGTEDGNRSLTSSQATGNRRLGLVRFCLNSLSISNIQVDQKDALTAEEWLKYCNCQYLGNNISTTGVLVFQMPSSNGWSIAFPVTTTRESASGDSIVRRRMVILPALCNVAIDDIGRHVQELQASTEGRILRDLYFCEKEGSIDMIDGFRSPLIRENPADLTEITLDRLLNSLAIAFFLATAVKLYLFFKRCGEQLPPHVHANKELCGADTVDLQRDLGSSAAGLLAHDWGWAKEMALCFLYGPASQGNV